MHSTDCLCIITQIMFVQHKKWSITWIHDQSNRPTIFSDSYLLYPPQHLKCSPLFYSTLRQRSVLYAAQVCWRVDLKRGKACRFEHLPLSNRTLRMKDYHFIYRPCSRMVCIPQLQKTTTDITIINLICLNRLVLQPYFNNFSFILKSRSLDYCLYANRVLATSQSQFSELLRSSMRTGAFNMTWPTILSVWKEKWTVIFTTPCKS